VPFASALSEHPVPAFATGEVCGEILDRVGPHPDLAVLFVTLAHAGALEDIVATVADVLGPSVVIGAASQTAIGVGREVESGPGISLWAGRWGPVLPVRLTVEDGPHGPRCVGLPEAVPFEPGALLVVGDPFSLPVEDLLAQVGAGFPGLPVIGGMASGARGPGASRLAYGRQVPDHGAVAALIGPGADVATVVSQGCRPIGQPFVITDGEGGIVRTLAGRAALERLEEVGTTLSPDDIRCINTGGLHLGRVVDERKEQFGTGDFRIRQVLGGDRNSGAIAVNDEVVVGTTVQFHLRDAASAHDELVRMLGRAGAVETPEAALLFTCNGRGSRLFGVPDHDAGVVAELLGPLPLAGIAAAGELGPVGGLNELHSFTASLLLVREHRADAAPL